MILLISVKSYTIVTVQPLTVGLGVLPNKWIKRTFSNTNCSRRLFLLNYPDSISIFHWEQNLLFSLFTRCENHSRPDGIDHSDGLHK